LKIAGSTIGWLAAIGAAIGLFVGIIDSINRASQAAAKAQQEALEASKSKADELAKENSALEKLAARYETLSGLTDRSRAETAEMRSIEQQLQSTYGLTGAALSGLAGSYDEVIKKIREKITAQKEEQLQESKTQMRIMQSQLEDNPYYEEMQNLERYKRDLQTYADTINNNQLFNNLDFSAQEEIKAKYNEINDEIAVATDNLEKMDAKYREEYMSLSGEMADLSVQIPVLEFEIANGSASEMTSAIVGAFSGAINAAAPGLSGAYSDAINSILSDADLSKTAENADALFDTLTGGGVLTADEQGQLADYIYSIWATLYKNIPKEFSGDKDGLMSQMFSQLFSVTPEMDNLASWIASFSEGNTQRLFETDQLESYTSKVNDAAKAYETAAKGSLELQEAMKQAQAAQEEAGQGTQEYDDALAEYNALSAELNAKNLESEAAFEALSEIIATVSELYPDLTSGSEAENQAQASLVAAYRRGDAALQLRGRTLKSTTKAVASSTKEFNKYTASQKDLQKWIDDQTDSLAWMNREIANSSELFSDVSGIKAQIDAGAQLDATQTGLIASLGLMGSTAQETSDNCAAWLARMADTLQGEIGKAESASNDLSDSLSFISAMHPDIKIGTSSAIAAMKAVVAQAIITIGYLNKAGIPTGGGGGGGGGNSKYQKDITALEHLKKLEQVDNEQELERLLELQQKYTNRRGKSTLKKADQRDLEERLFEVREKIREEAFNADMDEYEHRKRMGEMTVEQEIECLEKIKAAHELNADELWDMDERLYDLRKQLREDEKNDYEKSVTDTYDEVVSALQKRYEKERDIETKALKDKLDALDKEEKAEDDAEQRQEYRQELSDLQRKLRTEKSARERREIQKEIEELTA
ncbi:MAG: hypothetical protein PHU22_11045, partial [Eubacteriales bacterium]|nr:hypothetical protein [Eubacteriales bacterium]